MQSFYSSQQPTSVDIYLGCIDTYLGYDPAKLKNGYDCKTYKKRCGSKHTGKWSKMVKEACKDTCNTYSSEYCNLNHCKGLTHKKIGSNLYFMFRVYM